MNSQPFFSVVIPAWNRERFLAKCLDSVLGQDHTDFEVIIVDDGSTDGTRDLVARCGDVRVRYFYQENRGVSSARNKALREARGKYIAFLDSDDWWTKNKLSRARQYINDFPGINVFHTEEVWYKNGRLLSQKPRHKKPDGRVYTSALPLCCISISTAVVKKDVFDEIGAFDEGLEACEDYDFWLRATNRYEVKLIDEELTLKDGGRPDQLSFSVWGLDRFRIKALRKMLSSEILSDCDRKATLDELKKKCAIYAEGAFKRGKVKEAEYYKGLPSGYEKHSTR